MGRKPEEGKEGNYIHEVVLLGYDLKTERGKNLSDAQKSFLSRMRGHIWYAMRFTHRCVQVWDSVWFIRDPKEVGPVLEGAKRWRKAFADNGFGSCDISPFKMAMTDEGLKELKERGLTDLLDGLARLEKGLERLRGEKKVARSTLADIGQKLDVYKAIAKQDFGERHRRWNELKHEFQIIEDGIGELKRRKAE